MSQKPKRRFGVWMDSREASIVGYTPETTAFSVIGHASNKGPGANSSEFAANNLEITLVQKYFREIAGYLLNADEVHVTGTGTIQEEFVRYLGETAQFKKTSVSDSTSNPMSDEKLVEFVSTHFN